MSYNDKAERMQCDSCGQFYAFKEALKGGGGSWCFVPSSHVSYEENLDWCKRCTEKHGPPIPMQSVNLSLCHGVN